MLLHSQCDPLHFLHGVCKNHVFLHSQCDLQFIGLALLDMLKEFCIAADPFLNDQNFILSVLSLEELGATGNKVKKMSYRCHLHQLFDASVVCIHCSSLLVDGQTLQLHDCIDRCKLQRMHTVQVTVGCVA